MTWDKSTATGGLSMYPPSELFSETSYMTSQSLKNALGHLAYVLEGTKALKSIKPIALKAEFDREKISEISFSAPWQIPPLWAELSD